MTKLVDCPKCGKDFWEGYHHDCKSRIAFSVEEWRAFAEIMNDLTWGKACMDKWHRCVREPMEAKAKQVEHEAKLAADC